MHDYDKTKQCAEVKDFLEDEGELVVEYVNEGEEQINYTDLINIYDSRNEDGSNMWIFYRITGAGHFQMTCFAKLCDKLSHFQVHTTYICVFLNLL